MKISMEAFMKVYINPNDDDIREIIKRPELIDPDINSLIEGVFSNVRKYGDMAVKSYTRTFDKIDIDSFIVDVDSALTEPDPELDKALKTAYNNINKFHESQLSQSQLSQSKLPKRQIVETMPGVRCWQGLSAIDNIGLYIPGGRAPLVSTVLMLAVPAIAAGCKNIILLTPPQKDGTVNRAILQACQFCGIKQVFRIGGAQAIAAMAIGTETIPKANKIFGPGNQYVTRAKLFAQQFGVAIDMPAGPSEVMVIADDSASPAFIASDLLAQAEHGPDSQSILITDSLSILEDTQIEIGKQLAALPSGDIAAKSFLNSKIILVGDLEQAIAISNEYAPEHLIINARNYIDLADKIINAGSVFLGSYSPEAAGDYASGTNHTLPTNGYARTFSGVNVLSFMKTITYQEITREGLSLLAGAIETLAEAEGLEAHKRSVQIRLQGNQTEDSETNNRGIK